MKKSLPEIPWYAAGDAWELVQNGWEPEKNIYFETILTQSNGYLGVRGYPEEVTPDLKSHREGYLAGVFAQIDKAAVTQIKVDYPWSMLCMITLPEIFACRIHLAGEVFRLDQGILHGHRRSLSMRNGEMIREVDWESPSGHRTRLLLKRFLSAATPHLAMQKIEITPENWQGEAVLEFEMDGKTPSIFRCGDRSQPHLVQKLLEKTSVSHPEGAPSLLSMQTIGTHHRVVIASVPQHAVPLLKDPAVLGQKVSLQLKRGETGAVSRAITVASSRDVEEPAEVAKLASEVARDAIRAGYEPSLKESSQVWEHRWKSSDLVIEGPARDQAYLRYGTFSMLQMAPFHTDRMSIPARAYAFNRYHGLYYWDSETFLMPQFLHSHPEVAENLLSFRYNTLPGARRNAAHLGARGACFPWMTDSQDGCEQGPWNIGDYLWHQTADIAYAIDQYVRATGDVEFMRDKGLEILIEGARFWLSKLKKDSRGVYHLPDTVGPDELDKHGKDNGYVSLMTRHHLRLAGHWVRTTQLESKDQVEMLLARLQLNKPEIDLWLEASDRLAVPKVPGTDIPLQDEFLLAKKPMDFEGWGAEEAYAKRHTHRVVKQADVILAMFLLQEDFTTAQLREAYDFYEPMTLHYSSLSYNTHAILALRIGRERQAYEYFLKAAGLDLDNLKNATADGLHAAALGGTWQTVFYGFLGARLNPPGCLTLNPQIPKEWTSLSLQICFRGYRLAVHVSHASCRIEVDGSEGKGRAHLVLQNRKIPLIDGETLEIPLSRSPQTTALASK
jgi:alpha,alpha-trehalose phosphorylase